MNTTDLVKVVRFYGKLIPTFSRIGYQARSLTWPDKGPFDFSGQRWLVTGASEGIGRAIAKGALEGGAEVVAVARNAQRLEDLRNELSAEHAQKLVPVSADLSDSTGVSQLLAALESSGEPIHVLVNNVGLLLNEHSLTKEGRETSFSVNILGHYQLTEGLFDQGLITADAIIVNMSSGGLYNVPLSIEGLNVKDPEKYNGKASYAFAKRGQVTLTDFWDARLRKTGGRSYVMHPGWVKTPGVKTALPVFWKIQNSILRPPAQGADTALWLAAMRPESEKETVWFDRAPRSAHNSEATRVSLCSPEEFIDYLDSELKRAN